MKIKCPKCGHEGEVKAMPTYPHCPKCGYVAEAPQDKGLLVR